MEVFGARSARVTQQRRSTKQKCLDYNSTSTERIQTRTTQNDAPTATRKKMISKSRQGKNKKRSVKSFNFALSHVRKRNLYSARCVSKTACHDAGYGILQSTGAPDRLIATKRRSARVSNVDEMKLPVSVNAPRQSKARVRKKGLQ